MKRVIALFLAAVLSASLQATPTAGKQEIGLKAGINMALDHVSTKDGDQIADQFNLNYGKWFTEKFGLNLDLGLGHFSRVYTKEFSDWANPKSMYFNAGLEAKYAPISKPKFHLYLTGGLGMLYFNPSDVVSDHNYDPTKAVYYNTVGGKGIEDKTTLEVPVGLGFGYFFNDKLALNLAAKYHYTLLDWAEDYQKDENLKKVAFETKYGPSDANDGYVTASAGLSYFFEFDNDPDKDGIINKFDKCPKEAEDKDGFEDEDGCPDPDNDKDGIADLKDKCPNDAEDKDGFKDDDGCPDKDNDNDGVADAKDKCPNDAEDRDGFKDDDGCPDNDNDGDGIADAKDKAPNDAEDKDGYQDEDGAPDLDNDNDGIADASDKCPNEAENMNGFEDEDGCPDVKLLKKDERIVIDNIYFKTGSDQLTSDSFAVLDKLQTMFKENPKVKLLIEGHTDNLGKPKANLKLSEKRAKAVAKYISQKFGVNMKQLTAKGLGSTKPVADNKTKDGQAKNRRIEFKVLSNE